MRRLLIESGFVDIHVRPVIFGLPVFVRGTQQYPLIPEVAEPAFLNAADGAWNWVSSRGNTIRLASLFLSESYAISGRRG